MKKLLYVLVVLAAALALPGQARAVGQCGLPSQGTLWIDFGAPSLEQLFGRPGLVVGVGSGDFPARLRAAGAQTVFWDMNLNKRVGTPSAPTATGTIPDRANRLYDYAAAQSACEKPVILLNELFGAGLETPWSGTNARYRANVLTLVKTLSARGARSLLLVPAKPFTGSEEAAGWWREVSQHAELVPEVYFAAPAVWKQGPIVGSRRLRTVMRQRVKDFTDLGIPRSKLGIVLGFQTTKGGREGLQPREAWLEVVKWQVLAGRQVAADEKIGTVVSWGWTQYNPNAQDPDKEAAACVYLWTRDPSLCDGPAAGGPGFDASLTEGQIRLPAGRLCGFSGDRGIDTGSLAALQRLTGDREVAFSALLARVAESRYAKIPAAEVLAAERAVIASSFGGSAAGYRAALASAGATLAIARAALADELRRLRLESKMPARAPSAREVSAFYYGYPDLLARAVEVNPGPWWLGGRTRGLAFQSLAPEALFRLPLGRRTLRTLDGTYAVRVVGEVRPLGSIPFPQARTGISNALRTFGRRETFERWSLVRQGEALRTAACRRDDLPAVGTIRVTSYLPFLAAAGSGVV